MRPQDQLNEWVAGTSMHNHEHASCCPDFSCCLGPETMAVEKDRKDFLAAYQKGEWLIIQSYLNLFLDKGLRNGLALKSTTERVI